MSSPVKVFHYTQRIIVDPVDQSVTIINAGPQGPAGPSGSGVPAGGTTGQVLSKDSNTDGDVSWTTLELEALNGIPGGGTLAQVLAKAGSGDYDVEWVDPQSGPQGPQGIQGPPGADGADGEDGADGAQGPQGIQGIQGIQGPQGDPGPAGPQGAPGADGADGVDGSDGADGADGAPGVGVPPGGSAGQVLAKVDADDYDTEWINPPSGGEAENGIPGGGTAGQVLAKVDGTDYNAEWIDEEVEMQYVEGTTEAAIEGTAILWEDAGDELTTVSATTPLPVDATGTVDVSSSALPTGASTAANQTTIIGHVDGIESVLATIDSALAAIKTSVQLLDDAVSGTEIQVDVLTLPSLPAGTNNIGDVDVASLPALPAGTNNIGDVDVLSLPSLPAGSNNIGDVDVVSSALPTGASTAANQATIIGHVDGIEALLTTIDSTLTAVKTSVQLIDDTVSGTELQVDIVSSALPTGAATAANQTTIIGHVDGIETLLTAISGYVDGLEGLLTTIDGHVDGIEGNQATQTTSLQLLDDVVATTGSAITTKGYAVSGTDGTNARVLKTDSSGELQVDVLTLPTLPAGTNAIGKLAANSGVDIGDVDVTSLPALAAGTNLIGKVGLDTVSSASISSVACSTTVATLKASNSSRKGLIIFNNTGQILYVKFGLTATTSDFTLKIPDQAVYELPMTGLYTGQVTGILSTGSGNALVTEL